MSWHTVLDASGIVAASLVFAAFFMRDTVRLRQIAMGSNVAYALFAAGVHFWPTFVLHVLLFPLNAVRLSQLLRERRMIERALAASDVSPEWLQPFMARREYAAGDVLFRRGDAADCLFFLTEGRLVLDELGVQLEPGALLGEIGLFSPAGVRTATARAATHVVTHVLRREEALALYRRDPGFGIYLVRLITRRLVEDLARVSGPEASQPADASAPAARR